MDLHSDIRDMLIDLNRCFTRVLVEELQKKLNLKNKYKNFGHLRTYVLEQAQKDVEAHTNMHFSWKEIKAKKGRKIERLIFNIEVKDPEQVEMDFSFPSVDMSKHKTLQKYLRKICEFSDQNVKKVLRHVDEFPDDKQVFQKLVHKTELLIMDGHNNNARPVNDPQAWALKLFDNNNINL